jgi:hypothetical protein
MPIPQPLYSTELSKGVFGGSFDTGGKFPLLPGLLSPQIKTVVKLPGVPLPLSVAIETSTLSSLIPYLVVN